MKKGSDSIYRFIDQLAPVEKRYFKRYASRHVIGKENNYYRLFQKIDQNSLENDEEVKVELSDTKEKKNYPVVKKQLFDYLLDALHDYDKASSIKEEIKSGLHKSSILLNRGFVKESSSKLKKYKRQIQKYEIYSLTPELLSVEKQIIAKTFYNTVQSDDLINIYEVEQNYLRLLQRENEYWLLFSKIYKIHFTELRSRKQQDKAELNRLLNSTLLSEVKQAVTFKCKLDFYQLNALKCFLARDSVNAANYNRLFIEEFDKNAQMMKIYPERYLSTFNNLLIDMYTEGDMDKLRSGIEHLFSLQSHPSFKKIAGVELQVFRLGEQLKLNLAIKEKDFQSNTDRIPQIFKRIKSYGDAIAEQNLVTFYYLFSYSYFGTGDYQSCITWSNKIINETSESSLVELQLSARLLNLIAHFEMGNQEMLYYAINNTRRYHKRRNRLFAFEKIILSSLNKIISVVPGEREKVFLKLRSNIRTLKRNPRENKAMGNFDWEWWISGYVD